MLRSAPLRTCALVLGCVGLLVSAACSGRRTNPGGGAAPDFDPAAMQPPPVHSLLGYRERLELSSEQITRLDSIGQGLAAQRSVAGAPLAAGGRRIYGPGGGRRSPEEAAALDSIADLHRAAAAAVEATLTERQREQICELRRAEPTPARGGAGQGKRLYGPGSGGSGAPVLATGPYVWPWCRPATAPGDALEADARSSSATPQPER